MAKFTKKNRLHGKERDKLLFAFCHALSSVKSPKEAALFVSDLLSEQEAEMLAKRLKIAELLIQGKTFDKIKNQLKTSFGTIARVSLWLQESGEGFKKIVKRIPEYKEKQFDPEKWQQLKYKYPMYHWPQLLLEEIVVNAPIRRQEKLKAMLNKMSQKTTLYKRLNKIIAETYKSK